MKKKIGLALLIAGIIGVPATFKLGCNYIGKYSELRKKIPEVMKVEFRIREIKNIPYVFKISEPNRSKLINEFVELAKKQEEYNLNSNTQSIKKEALRYDRRSKYCAGLTAASFVTFAVGTALINEGRKDERKIREAVRV